MIVYDSIKQALAYSKLQTMGSATSNEWKLFSPVRGKTYAVVQRDFVALRRSRSRWCSWRSAQKSSLKQETSLENLYLSRRRSRRRLVPA